jgi:uncharacterized protein (TIGR03435 family)
LSTPRHTVIVGSRNVILAEIAEALSQIGRLARPVVDRTGLEGRFDFTVEWMLESNSPPQLNGDNQADSSGPTLLEALQEQLGLKLESAEAPVRIPVIDHIEQPSEN